MRDSAGQPVWQGPVVADGIAFNVPATAFAPSTRDERHLHVGYDAAHDARYGLERLGCLLSSTASSKTSTLQANTPDPIAAAGGAGTNSERDGTGWHTFEMQGVYTPSDDDWTGGAHTLAFGYHRNDYRLESPVYNTLDWRGRAGTLAQDARGETSLQALYAQDAWTLAERWVLTLGVRYEDWQASNGLQFVARSRLRRVYPSRTEREWSPKASLAVPAATTNGRCA